MDRGLFYWSKHSGETQLSNNNNNKKKKKLAILIKESIREQTLTLRQYLYLNLLIMTLVITLINVTLHICFLFTVVSKLNSVINQVNYK